MNVERRCRDCIRIADDALDDADWILAAGGSPSSEAVVYDQALARVWLLVAEVHDGPGPT